MSSKKIVIVSEDFTRENGGIQMWSSLISAGIEKLGLADVEEVSYEENKVFLTKILKSTSVLIMNIRVLKYMSPIFFLISYFKKITLIVHGDDFLYKNFLERLFLWSVLKLPRLKIYSNSKYTKERLHKIWGIKSEVCFPFVAVNKEPCNMDDRHENKKKRFLTIGRLAKRKNHRKIIEALHLLEGTIGDYVYIIVGAGPEYKNLSKFVEDIGMSGKVEFKGRVTEEEKIYELTRANYLLLPSIELTDEASVEGFGMVFIEANHYGIPVLGGQSGGMPEAIIEGVTGQICDGSVEGIVNGIASLIDNDYVENELFIHAEKFNYETKTGFYVGLL